MLDASSETHSLFSLVRPSKQRVVLRVLSTLSDAGDNGVLARGLLKGNAQALGTHRRSARVFGGVGIDAALGSILNLLLALDVVA